MNLSKTLHIVLFLLLGESCSTNQNPYFEIVVHTRQPNDTVSFISYVRQLSNYNNLIIVDNSKELGDGIKSTNSYDELGWSSKYPVSLFLKTHTGKIRVIATNLGMPNYEVLVSFFHKPNSDSLPKSFTDSLIEKWKIDVR